MAYLNLLKCTLGGCNYTLELYSDLGRLRNLVPSNPSFDSYPYHVAMTSAAHVFRASNTVACTPCRGFTPLHNAQGSLCRHSSRVRVARSPCFTRIGSKNVFQRPAPVIALRAQLRAQRFIGIVSYVFFGVHIDKSRLLAKPLSFFRRFFGLR